MLDTNILSALVRAPHGAIADRIKAVGEGSVYTSVVVAAELRFGAARKGSERLTRQIEAILAAIEIGALQPPADRAYGALRWRLEQDGVPIGANDMLIAAQAIADGSVLVTDNTREFTRVPGLTVENWLRQ